MKKYLFGAAMLLMVGGGCVAADNSMTTDETGDDVITRDDMLAPDEMGENESGGRVADPIAFPSGTYEMYRAPGYALPIDQEFTIDQQGDQLRIQNFEASDNPRYDYADDAFFIEIFSNVSGGETEAAFSKGHASVSEATMGGESVLKGDDRVVAGDSWPGHSYYSTDRDVIIRVYYQDPAGSEIAEAILSHLSWE